MAKNRSKLSTTAQPVQPQNATQPQPQTRQQAQAAQPQAAAQQQAQQQVQQQAVQNQVPNSTNTPVSNDPIKKLQGMTDAQLAAFYQQSQQAVLPNHLSDADDKTQKFVFTLGMNAKPMVLDQKDFNKFMSDNGIPKAQMLARDIRGGILKTSSGNSTTLTSDDVADMLKYSRMNYIGGKHGGQRFGAGTYFDMNGGVSTGYGGYSSNSTTVVGVLNPKTAKIVTSSRLAKEAAAFDRSHPQFAKATGGYDSSFYNNNMSIYATVLGYNVIKDSIGSYHNVIDRSALVLLK